VITEGQRHHRIYTGIYFSITDPAHRRGANLVVAMEHCRSITTLRT